MGAQPPTGLSGVGRGVQIVKWVPGLLCPAVAFHRGGGWAGKICHGGATRLYSPCVRLPVLGRGLLRGVHLSCWDSPARPRIVEREGIEPIHPA